MATYRKVDVTAICRVCGWEESRSIRATPNTAFKRALAAVQEAAEDHAPAHDLEWGGDFTLRWNVTEESE